MSTPDTKMRERREIFIRPEFVADSIGEAVISDVAQLLSLVERIWDNNAVRKGTILLGLVVENLIFRNIEARTIIRWGMSR